MTEVFGDAGISLLTPTYHMVMESILKESTAQFLPIFDGNIRFK